MNAEQVSERLARTTLSEVEKQAVNDKLAEGSINPSGWIFLSDIDLSKSLKNLIQRAQQGDVVMARFKLLDRTEYDDDLDKLLDLVTKANLPEPKSSIVEKYCEGRRVRDSEAYALTVENPSTVASKGCYDMSNFNISSLYGEFKTSVKVVSLNNDKLRTFIAGRLFNGSIDDLVHCLADLTPVLSQLRSLFVHLREKKFGYTEPGFFQPLYTLFLERVSSRIGRSTCNKTGSSFLLSMDADVVLDNGNIETVTIAGKTDIVKVPTLDDVDFDIIEFLLELKAPFASLYHATSGGPKGQLVSQLLGLWEMSSENRVVSMGGLTDIFAIIICFAYSDGRREFSMTKSVVDAEEYLLYFMLLFCSDQDVRELVEAEGDTDLSISPNSDGKPSNTDERESDSDCGGRRLRSSSRPTGTKNTFGRRTANQPSSTVGSAKSKRKITAEEYDVCFEGESDLQKWYARHNGLCL